MKIGKTVGINGINVLIVQTGESIAGNWEWDFF